MPMKFSMRWSGDAVHRLFESAADRTARKAAAFMMARAKFNCPVDTGYLSSTIGTMEGGRPGSQIVIATAHYAAPVEFGHVTQSGSFVPPQPFMRNALAETVMVFPDLARQGWVEATTAGGEFTGSIHGADLGGG